MITIYFGLPRSGKSTLICKILRDNKLLYNRNVKRAKNLYPHNTAKRHQFFDKKQKYLNFVSNMDNKLCPTVSVNGLGTDFVYPSRSLVLIDEAGIEYNSRLTLKLPKQHIEYLKLHGHYETDIMYFSQTWEDIDVTLRRLAERYYYIKRLGPFSLVRRIKRVIMINDDKQIVDGFEFYPIIKKFLPFPWGIRDSWRLVFRPKYYKYFDSYSKIDGVPELRLN